MIATLRAFHEGWSWVVVIGNGIAAVWALGAMRWSSLRRRALWWFTAVAEVAVFVEVALGVALVGQNYSAPEFHMFYGFVALISIGIIYSYRQQLHHRLYLLYGLGGLFIMGLGVRAMFLGRP